jgi:hypothetical protein
VAVGAECWSQMCAMYDHLKISKGGKMEDRRGGKMEQRTKEDLESVWNPWYL